MKKLNQKNILSTAVSMLMTFAMCSGVSVQASDIEIYRDAEPTTITLMMLIDISGSMDYSSYGGGSACDVGGTKTKHFAIQKPNPHPDAPSYRRQWCTSSTVAGQHPDRITRVKDGMIDLLFGNESQDIVALSDDKVVGFSSLGWVKNPTATFPDHPDKLLWDGTSTNNGVNRLPPYSPMRCENRNADKKDIDNRACSPTTNASVQTNYPLVASELKGVSKEWENIGSIVVPARRLDAEVTIDGVTMTQRKYLAQEIANIAAITNTPTATSYAETAAYLLGETTKDKNFSGFLHSNPNSRDENKYIPPTSMTQTSQQKQCHGQGIYVLTDGEPHDTNVTNIQTLMKSALGSSHNQNFNCDSLWKCINTLSDKLLDPNANPKGVKIKTAVIGFGAGFNKVADASTAQKEAMQWGINGEGGWYSGSNAQDIVNSVNQFLGQIEVEIPAVATGSPTIPQDALNPLRIQPYGYYASFEPKPQEAYQLWLGNLNKYHIFNGELRDGTTASSTRLILDDGSLNASASGLWPSGMRGQLSLGIGTSDVTNRKIFTNRQITGETAPYTSSAATSLKQVNVTTLFGTGSTALFVNDPDKNYWLNLLGYNVGATESGITLTALKAKPELRQLGAVMHSTPILLTQQGKITVNTSGQIDTTDREDYLLFGSTQGLLHVVHAGKSITDTNRGKEVFSFVPHEMMQKQKRAFLTENSTTGGKDNLFYGIDAPWTAHTQYIAKSGDDEGVLTVRNSGRTVRPDADGEEIALKGLQWVYGGLRMGGRSYYALDLSDIGGTTPNPVLKFHINPDGAIVTDEDGNTTPDTNNAISYMGQSWSKPTIAYVNFGGVKKLVMFVGGGYDIGYENATYNQSTTTGGGAGVYMFDANNGDLLWWASANATAAKGAQAFTDASADTINMKYSVVSQINAIDRDNDGLVDHLYFGDLGGQAFRVDLNNGATGADAAAKKANFATRAVRLYSTNVNTGLSPRFYEMPSFSVHSGVDGVFGVAAFSSGNRSSPLANAANSASDAVHVIYDNDVARTDLYSAISLRTQNVTLSDLTLNTGVAQTTGTGESRTYNGGWKYHYSNSVSGSSAGRFKGLNELYALDNILYVNVYDRDGTGIGGACGAGVYGDSYLYQFCLPTGKCDFYSTATTTPHRVKLGAGILGAGLGQAFDNNSDNTSLVVNRDEDLDCTGENANKPECQKFSTTAKLRQLRWYEAR